MAEEVDIQNESEPLGRGSNCPLPVPLYSRVVLCTRSRYSAVKSDPMGPGTPRPPRPPPLPPPRPPPPPARAPPTPTPTSLAYPHSTSFCSNHHGSIPYMQRSTPPADQPRNDHPNANNKAADAYG